MLPNTLTMHFAYGVRRRHISGNLPIIIVFIYFFSSTASWIIITVYVLHTLLLPLTMTSVVGTSNTCVRCYATSRFPERFLPCHNRNGHIRIRAITVIIIQPGRKRINPLRRWYFFADGFANVIRYIERYLKSYRAVRLPTDTVASTGLYHDFLWRFTLRSYRWISNSVLFFFSPLPSSPPPIVPELLDASLPCDSLLRSKMRKTPRIFQTAKNGNFNAITRFLFVRMKITAARTFHSCTCPCPGAVKCSNRSGDCWVFLLVSCYLGLFGNYRKFYPWFVIGCTWRWEKIT